MGNSQLSWETVCAFLQIVSKYRRNPYMKPKTINAFLERCILKDSGDAYQVFRLVFPESDVARVSYGLDEYRLIYGVLVAVETMEKGSNRPRDESLFRWRDKDSLALALGEPRELSALLKERIFDHVCGIPENSENIKRLKVCKVNDMLDALAASHGEINAQVDILRSFIDMTTPMQMMWLVQVILKKVRSYISEKDLLEAWGADEAEKRYAKGWHLSDILDNPIVDGNLQLHEGFAHGQRWYCQKPYYARNIKDAYGYMERRFKYGYGELVVVGEAHVDGLAIQAHRRDGQVTLFSNKSDDRYHKALYEPLMNMIPLDKGNFVVEGKVVAWNASTLCFEPSFVLEAVLSNYGDISNGFETIKFPMYPSYKSTQYADIEVVILLSDVLSLGGEVLVHQALELRLESLETNFKYTVFERRSEEGFPVRVKIVPQIPGACTIAGVLLSIKSSDVEELAVCRRDAQSLGANGFIMRALEPDWNSPDIFSKVVVWQTPGKYVIECAVIGAWMDALGNMSDLLLGIQSSRDMVKILKVRNNLHLRDVTLISSRMRDYIQGSDFCSFDSLQEHVLVTVAGNIVPAGKWNDTLVIQNPDILGVSSSSKPTSIEDIHSMMLHRRESLKASHTYHVAFKGRSVPKRFLPCELSEIRPLSEVLSDHVIYFVNYEDGSSKNEMLDRGNQQKYSTKCLCEELVKKLGGTVSQNYSHIVDFVVAGHATKYTECFREKNIAVLSVTWLKQLYHTCPETLPRITDADYLPEWTPIKKGSTLDIFKISSEEPSCTTKELVRKTRDETPKGAFSTAKGKFDAAYSPHAQHKRFKSTPPKLETPQVLNPAEGFESKGHEVDRQVEKMVPMVAPPPETKSAIPELMQQDKPKLSLKERAKKLRFG